MPVSTVPPSNVEIHIKGTISAAGSNNRLTDWAFYFARNSLVPTLNKAGIDTAFQAAIMVPLGAALNNRFLQSQNTVRFPDDATDAPVAFNHAVVGAVAGDSMPTLCQAFMLFRTGLRGKHYRGSKKFGPLSESDTTAATADLLNAGAQANWAAVAAAILAGFTDAQGNTWIPTVLSKGLSQLRTNPTTIVASFVTQVLTRKSIGRIKKREVKSVY
jgi:hypothetical protein